MPFFLATPVLAELTGHHGNGRDDPCPSPGGGAQEWVLEQKRDELPALWFPEDPGSIDHKAQHWHKNQSQQKAGLIVQFESMDAYRHDRHV